MKKMAKQLFASMALVSLLSADTLIAANPMVGAFSQNEPNASSKCIDFEGEFYMVQTLPTKGTGDCALRAIAPEEKWREEGNACRNWAADLLTHSLENKIVKHCLATEISYQERQKNLPMKVRELFNRGCKSEDLEVIKEYIESYVRTETNKYMNEQGRIGNNYLELLNEQMQCGVANALTYLQGRCLVIVTGFENLAAGLGDYAQTLIVLGNDRDVMLSLAFLDPNDENNEKEYARIAGFKPLFVEQENIKPDGGLGDLGEAVLSELISHTNRVQILDLVVKV